MRRWFLSGAMALVATGALLTFSPAEAEAQRRDRDLITREELVQSSQKSSDLYQAVRGLRSHFLQEPRGLRSMGVDPPRTGGQFGAGRGVEVPTAVLYVNGTRSGDIEMMRNYQTINVREVRYLNPNAASMQFGQGHEGGAVLVTLMNAPDRE